MSNYFIDAATAHRISSVCNYFRPDVKIYEKSILNVLRLENRSGQSYAIATNKKIASIQRLGPTQNPDGAIHIRLDFDMKKLFEEESKKETVFNISTIPEIAMSFLTTESGISVSDICEWLDSTPMDKWRDWIDHTPPDASYGTMEWDIFDVESLIKSSPSGRVTFQEFIDVRKPVTLKDSSSYEWVGLFIPSDNYGHPKIEGASKPTWWD